MADLAAPEAVKAAAAPTPPAPNVTVEEVGKGIWWLAGSSHRSVAFEFDDHITLFEMPLDEARTKAVIEKARTLRPGKPVTHAVVSHHHLDHAGGVRTAMADAPVPVPAPPTARPSFRDRLAKARGALGGYLGGIRSRKVDAETWEELEEALIRADVGVSATQRACWTTSRPLRRQRASPIPRCSSTGSRPSSRRS